MYPCRTLAKNPVNFQASFDAEPGRLVRLVPAGSSGPSTAFIGPLAVSQSNVSMRHIKIIGGKQLILLGLLLLVVGEFLLSNSGLHSVVQGQSMYPTLRHNDVVQTHAPAATPQRGAVVIITDPYGDQLIKRIIGLPGESVTLLQGFVYINGQRLDEPYLSQLTYTFLLNTREGGAVTWKLGDNQYFVLGDNRMESVDSRNFGPVDRAHIRRVVDLPKNSFRPSFSDIIISSSGLPMRRSQIQNGESF